MFIFVTVIHDCLDSGLDDRLGTLVARKQRNIKLCSFQTATTIIQDCIQLAVRHIQIFRIQRIPFPCPRKLIIGTALRKAIISHGKNLVIIADNTGTHL